VGVGNGKEKRRFCCPTCPTLQKAGQRGKLAGSLGFSAVSGRFCPALPNFPISSYFVFDLVFYKKRKKHGSMGLKGQ
jgi:hypothetical protein